LGIDKGFIGCIMKESRRRLGGADRRVAAGGVGSSPAVSTFPNTNSKKVLRKMLSDRDRRLSLWDRANPNMQRILQRMLKHKCLKEYEQWDAERKLIREKLKGLRNA